MEEERNACKPMYQMCPCMMQNPCMMQEMYMPPCMMYQPSMMGQVGNSYIRDDEENDSVPNEEITLNEENIPNEEAIRDSKSHHYSPHYSSPHCNCQSWYVPNASKPYWGGYSESRWYTPYHMYHHHMYHPYQWNWYHR